MKKIITLLFAVAMLLSLFACGSESEKKSGNTKEAEDGVIQNDMSEIKISEEEEGIIQTVMSAIKNGDGEDAPGKIFDITTPNVEFNNTENDLKEFFKTKLNTYYGNCRDKCGKDFDLDYKILSITETTADEIDSINKVYEKTNSDIENKRGYYVDLEFVDGALEKEYKAISGKKQFILTVTVKGNDDIEYVADSEVLIEKIGSQWYLRIFFLRELTRDN